MTFDSPFLVLAQSLLKTQFQGYLLCSVFWLDAVEIQDSDSNAFADIIPYKQHQDTVYTKMGSPFLMHKMSCEWQWTSKGIWTQSRFDTTQALLPLLLFFMDPR